jgi:hypothetical protein
VDVHFTVNLADLKRAVRRLTMRLGDESLPDGRFVTFHAASNALEITTVNSSEELFADVSQSGTANVPVAVFCTLAKTLRFHRSNRVECCISSRSIAVSER